MTEIVLESLSKRFPGGVRAVDDLNLRVESGELMALVGPSGCGKTTVLRLIAGLETPDGGEIRLGGKRVNETPPHRRGDSMVFQEPALYPHLSGLANLMFGLRLAKQPRREAEGKARAVAESLKITHLLDRRPATLSGGEAQRFALGRALARGTGILLLDEPLTQLDAPLREELGEEIRQQHARLGATFLLVAHDQREALRLGQRVAVQREGRIQQVGTPRELLESPATVFVAGFLGIPKENFVQGRISTENNTAVLGAEGGGIPLSAVLAQAVPDDCEEVVLALRPEHITLGDADGAVEARIDEAYMDGPDTVLIATAFGRRWRVRAPLEQPARPGERCSLSFTMERAHLFDASSGLRLEA